MARPQFPYREEQFVFYFPKKRCVKFSQGNYHPFLIFQNWKTRWFTLHRNELKYFKDQTVSSEHQFHSSNLCRGSCNLLLPLSSCISITAYQATASHAVRGVRPFSQSFADDLSEQVIKFYSQETSPVLCQSYLLARVALHRAFLLVAFKLSLVSFDIQPSGEQCY